ncbi:MAG: threonine ammonia-lyase, biosynthetic [Opitutales bacterium]|jgi:threonine dehydratase|nr:threonine ammonia-lyase, biosynthetic [Opitutales bacterium]MDG2169219.1 threonine ammonia-lyase, biosynthetic [Opitutales bacterium]
MKDQLIREILKARQRVYSLAPATPLQELDLQMDFRCFIKREDLSPINAYKWRGAYNRMCQLSSDDLAQGVITASAGNHAQGVALSAKKLGTKAIIYMPLSTPKMKQNAVKRLGGDQVSVVLKGDSYDEAANEAKRISAEQGITYIHAYDDMQVMAGQGTIADEIIMSGEGPFDVVFLQIGGGGLAGSIAAWLKNVNPDTRIIGVEGEHQASMAAAMKAGKPVELDYVDVFCDGTAVKQVGELTYSVCRDVIDEFMTVTNEEVSAAIEVLWNASRVIPEPSGAMGLAAILKRQSELSGKKVVSILCGANMDFHQLGNISSASGIGSATKRYLRFHIGEHPGELLRLLEEGLDGFNIVDFQYGKTHEVDSWPILGVEGSSEELEQLPEQLKAASLEFEDVTSSPDVSFRVIPFRSRLITHPYFIELEFPERAGALHDFLNSVRGSANICYFNYQYTGERVGRAMIGFEFPSEEERGAFTEGMSSGHWQFRAFQELPEDVLKRIAG